MEKNNKEHKRRAFLQNGLKVIGGSVLLGPLLNSCSDSFYNTLTIDEALCIGCKDCDDVCNYDAIVINGVSNYAINETDCTLCNWCVDVCKDKAILMPAKSYKIISAKCTGCNDCIPSCDYGALKIASNQFAIKSGCVGCGDCVTACNKEGKAIFYVVSEYSVKRGQCRGCVQKCSGACKYGAISSKEGRAYIDTTKCTKCGDCLKACGYGAIKNAYVIIDQNKCTHCGECYNVCTYEQIEKSGNPDLDQSYIEKSECTNCGKCISACPEEAIYVEQSGDYTPEIDNGQCTACGKCFDVCTVQKAIDRTVATASIIQTNCLKCNKCFDVCNYHAVRIE